MKARKIRKSDKLPELPYPIIPTHILITKSWVYIWGFDIYYDDKEYFLTWDKESSFPSTIEWRRYVGFPKELNLKV